MKFFYILIFLFPILAQAEQIEDNSFLVEESYNQEPGVVQFIQVYQQNSKNGDWNYVFVNEIPVLSQTHQFSYELPYEDMTSSGAKGLGDIKLNYRNELFRSEKIVTTGRVSTTLPTGKYEDSLGSGNTGFEFSLMSSITISDKWVQHWNVGYGITPKAKNSAGDAADNNKYFWNLSNVYLYSDSLNFMLEMSTFSEEETVAAGQTVWSSNTIISPSFRYAFDIGKFQVVPGVGLPVVVGENPGQDNSLLLYLSIEGKLW